MKIKLFVLVILAVIVLACGFTSTDRGGSGGIVIYPTYGTSRPRPTATATYTPIRITIYPTKIATSIPRTRTPTVTTDGTVISINP